jgi:predicted peroxiredoxin
VLPGEERRLIFLSMDNEVCFVWLAGALQLLRQEERTKIVGYLEAVLDEVVFEAKMAPSKSTSIIVCEPPVTRCDSERCAIRVSGLSLDAGTPHTDARE